MNADSETPGEQVDPQQSELALDPVDLGSVLKTTRGGYVGAIFDSTFGVVWGG